MTLSVALVKLTGAISVCKFSSLRQPRDRILSTWCVHVSPKVKLVVLDNQTIIRRSANYKPTLWDDNYIQSLKSDYTGESCDLSHLKIDAKIMFDKLAKMEYREVKQLELIDTLQRLGVAYHFEQEIKGIIHTIYDTNYANNAMEKRSDLSLYAASLEFRLLRQHGYNISQEIFCNFEDLIDNLKAVARDDKSITKEILYLYEASFLMVEGETILEKARNSTSKFLKQYVNQHQLLDINTNEDQILFELVSHALELPIHWRLSRLEARWFIDLYERSQGMNSTLLQFAKLDFNMVQAIHQADIQHDSRWWTSTRLAGKLPFSRDRIMENFLWAVGMSCEPQSAYFRKMNTKLHQLLTTIDDVYDVYGTLDELEIFTEVIQSWDVNEMERLPDYMKIAFLAMYNAMNEMSYDALKEHGANVVPFIKKAWGDLCKCYLLEAKWYYSGYKPTLEEFMENGWFSTTIPVMLTHAYLVTSPLSNHLLESLFKYPPIIRNSSTVIRLIDDLGTSSDEIKRGDVPKSIQCYMNETGATEEEAREHIHYLISENWKKVNEDQLNDSSWSPIFKDIVTNVIRAAHSIYLYGDGHASQDCKVQDQMDSLFMTPIP